MNLRRWSESSCIHCHDSSTETDLDFERLSIDLSTPSTLRKWERIFDRISDGEMPPESEDRPDQGQLASALKWLNANLREAGFGAAATIRSRSGTPA